MKRELTLEKGKPYHIIARAVEGRTIFPSREELSRFIVQMYSAIYNIPLHLERRNIVEASDALLFGQKLPRFLPEATIDPLVELFSFGLVGNHYHLGLVGQYENAISKYMQRLNTGFAKYFNLKHRRDGFLFGSRFQAVAVTSPRQLAALVDYINIKNVLDVWHPSWYQAESMRLHGAMKFLREYPYSSFSDIFLGRKSYMINKDLLYNISEGLFPTKDTNVKERVQDVMQRRGVIPHVTLPAE